MEIRDKKQLKLIIQYERELWIKRMYPGGSPKSIRSLTLIFMKALRNTEFYGIQPKWKKLNLNYFFYKFAYKIISIVTNVSIPPYVFEKGLLIMHLQNIVVSSKVHADENLCLYHNTTLGIKNNGMGSCPKIGRGVTICTGACILGDVHLADGILVAANAVVVKSFEENNVIVGGIPAKVIGRNPEWSMQRFVEKITSTRDEERK